jgi:hypothetical protein
LLPATGEGGDSGKLEETTAFVVWHGKILSRFRFRGGTWISGSQ